MSEGGGVRNVGPTLVRADARKREWFACNGVGMRAVSRAPLNMLLDGASQQMILWTIQSPEAVAVLERQGVLVADAGDIEPSFQRAYRWMEAQMLRRIGPSNHRGRSIWAWRAWTDQRARPDLRSTGHLARGFRGARIEFGANPATVLLSDFSLWHYVLNYWYLAASLKDQHAFESEVKAAGLDYFATKPLPDPALHSRIEASWNRIFDLDVFIKGITEKRGTRSIQATLWALPLNAVREITWFTAR